MDEINLDESMLDILDDIENGTNDADKKHAEDGEVDLSDMDEIADEIAKGGDTEADEVDDGADAVAPVVAEVEELEPRLNMPPTTWTAEAKANYKDLPPWAKKEVHKREEDVIRGISNLKEQSQFGQRMQQVVTPYMAMLNQKGVPAENAVQAMLNTLYTLETATPAKKAELIRDLATRYNADMGLISKPEDPQQMQVRQYIAPLEQRIQQLQQVINGQQTSAREQQLSEATKAVETFAMTTDEKGALKYPYFENVSEMMASFVESGRATTLEQAYDIAVWADPSTRALLQSEQTKVQQAQSAAKAKEKADKARNANKLNLDKRGAQESSQRKPTGSIDDTLNEVYERLNAQ